MLYSFGMNNTFEIQINMLGYELGTMLKDEGEHNAYFSITFSRIVSESLIYDKEYDLN